MKELFYNFDGQRPSIVGKYDESGEWILPSTNELPPARIAGVIAKRIQRFHDSEHMHQVLQWMEAKEGELALPRANFPRVPHYCSGCPRTTSTPAPECSPALDGTACHNMVTCRHRTPAPLTNIWGDR